MQGPGFRMQGLGCLGSIGLQDSHVGPRCRDISLKYFGVLDIRLRAWSGSPAFGFRIQMSGYRV